MDLEILYPLITEAIRRAETLEDLRAPGVHGAYLDVSLLEEKVAEVLPASDPEGALARRGAVRAALAARDITRARELTDRFLAEAGTGELRDELLKLKEQAERAVAARYPRVAATIGILEVQRLARAFIQQGAPFPIG
jgi:hypothetical protein